MIAGGDLLAGIRQTGRSSVISENSANVFGQLSDRQADIVLKPLRQRDRFTGAGDQPDWVWWSRQTRNGQRQTRSSYVHLCFGNISYGFFHYRIAG